MIFTAKPTRFMSSLLLFAGTMTITLALAPPCAAQMGGIDPDPSSPGTGGRNVIEGRIYYPSGRNVDKRFKVHMSGIRGGDFFTMADDTGAFSFRRVGSGSYVITIDVGNDYEPVNERVDVIDAASARGSAIGRTYNLQIQLRLRANASMRPGTINAALANVPKAATELYEKALESERTGDTNKALQQLQQAVTLYPDFSLALNEIALIHQRLGQFDKAADALAEAIRSSPDIFELRLNYGIVLLKNNRLSDADVQLKRAIELKDTSTLAHLYRGKLLIQMRNYAEAEPELQRVIKLGGDDVPTAYRFLGALYKERGDNKAAIDALEKYLKLNPKVKDAESVRQIIKELRNQLASAQ